MSRAPDDPLTRVYALVKGVWPTGATLLSPDHLIDFEAALGQPSDDRVVVRYWRPQLTDFGTIARWVAFADVCARTDAKAYAEAQKLLGVIDRDARNPSGHHGATATPIRETSYFRVHVTWNLTTD